MRGAKARESRSGKVGYKMNILKKENYFLRSTSWKLSSEVTGGDLKFIISVRGSCY